MWLAEPVSSPCWRLECVLACAGRGSRDRRSRARVWQAWRRGRQSAHRGSRGLRPWSCSHASAGSGLRTGSGFPYWRRARRGTRYPGPGECDGVPDRPHLHSDQVVELVAAVRGGGEPEPAPCRDLLDRVLERGGRDVVAFVGDDQAVPGGQLRDILAAGQGLQGDDIDGAAQLGPAAAELPGFDAEELGDSGPP